MGLYGIGVQCHFGNEVEPNAALIKVQSFTGGLMGGGGVWGGGGGFIGGLMGWELVGGWGYLFRSKWREAFWGERDL